jgi:hypothetical protein
MEASGAQRTASSVRAVDVGARVQGSRTDDRPIGAAVVLPVRSTIPRPRRCRHGRRATPRRSACRRGRRDAREFLVTTVEFHVAAVTVSIARSRSHAGSAVCEQAAMHGRTLHSMPSRLLTTVPTSGHGTPS